MGNLKEYTPLETLQAYNRIICHWAADLSPTQLSVLLFIASRTIGWGKGSERISNAEIENGIPRLLADGLPVHRGTGLGRTAVKRTVQELVGMGVVTRVTSVRATYMGINLEWEPIMLRRPKSARGLAALADRVMDGVTKGPPEGHDVTPRGSLLDPLIYHSEAGTPEANTAAPAEPACGSLSLDQALTNAYARVDAGMAKKTARATASPTPARLEEVWRAAMLSAFPSDPLVSWTSKERGMVRSGLVKQVSFTGTQFVDFLQWIVAEWDIIVHARFHWLREPAPIRPAITFVIGMRTHFFNAYASRDRLLTEARMSFDDRQILSLTRQGFSEEEARAKVEERKTSGRDRIAMEEKRRDAERIIRIAQRVQHGVPAVPLSPDRRATSFVRTPLPEV